MKYLLFALVSTQAFAFNDWLIECRQSLDSGELITISDERINGDKNNRITEITLWNNEGKIDWTGGGRLYVSNKSVRESVFFLKGKRVDYKLTYDLGFTKLPSQSKVDLSKPNSSLRIDFYQGISSSTPIENSVELEIACYYRKGGE